MNELQQFMADGNEQTRAIIQEAVTIDGDTYYGTFGDPQVLPVMTRQGYEDHLVRTFLASADQFDAPPAKHQPLTRTQGSVEYFIQAVDAKDPVVFTFILTDREL